MRLVAHRSAQSMLKRPWPPAQAQRRGARPLAEAEDEEENDGRRRPAFLGNSQRFRVALIRVAVVNGAGCPRQAACDETPGSTTPTCEVLSIP